jgi:glycosyltransferase involved in cell wall biosynthesis
MHIAIITNRLIKGEGQGRVNMALARSAARHGHVVTCLAYRVDNRLLTEPNVEWAHMPDANSPVALIGNQRFARASTRWLNRHGTDVDFVVANGFNTWAPTDLNIVHFVHSAWRQSDAHDAHIRSVHGAYQWLYSRLNARLERTALSRAQHVVAVSEKVRTELIELGMSPHALSVIHNGVDIEEFAPGTVSRQALGLPDVPLALFAGDISTTRKGLDTMLEALQHVPGLHLAVAGQTDGSPFPALAEQLGVADRTHFLGFRADMPILMQAADVFVFPSRYEACSLVLLEAMSAGLPVITAQTAGGAELISSDAGVVLPDPDDATALAAALNQLTTDPNRLTKMRAAARTLAEDHSWDRMGIEYLRLFETLSRQKSERIAPIPHASSLSLR